MLSFWKVTRRLLQIRLTGNKIYQNSYNKDTPFVNYHKKSDIFSKAKWNEILVIPKHSFSSNICYIVLVTFSSLNKYIFFFYLSAMTNLNGFGLYSTQSGSGSVLGCGVSSWNLRWHRWKRLAKIINISIFTSCSPMHLRWPEMGSEVVLIYY